MRIPVIAAIFLLGVIASRAVMADARASLSAGPVARVVEVVDGDTVVLDAMVEGASQVRLVGIQAPKLPLGRKGFPKWPLAAAAKMALTKIIGEEPVRLSFGGSRMDRHRRHLAHLHLGDGTWVQGRMLRLGMARVYSFSDNRALVAEMLALEDQARTARRGIWGLRYYAVRSADDVLALSRDVGTFQLVEGRVFDVARVKGTVYLNFGANWRDDFTISVDARARRLFSEAGIDPLALNGQAVRVRGWLKRRNGPLIVVTHPEQLEVLPP